MNKNFSFEFTKTDSGWLDFEIHIQNATFHYSFSDVVSTKPEELILWLEKIYNKDYCEFECDTEDFFFWFDYDGKEFRLYDQNNLIYEDRKRSCLWANEKVEELKKRSSNGERFTQVQFLGQSPLTKELFFILEFETRTQQVQSLRFQFQSIKICP